MVESQWDYNRENKLSLHDAHTSMRSAIPYYASGQGRNKWPPQSKVYIDMPQITMDQSIYEPVDQI
jgi:hypothetical protein